MSPSNTLAALRAQCRLFLASASDWPDAALDSYIADAIRFYSNEYPRLASATIAASAGTRCYALADGHDILAVYSALYEGSELTSVPRNDLRLAASADVFAFYDGQIEIGPLPVAGATITVTYTTHHAIPSAGDDPLTIPSAHWEALIAFVDFRCHWQLESGQAILTDANNITLSQLGQESRLAWNRFKEVVDRIAYRQQGQSAVVSWGERRIY